MRAYLVETGLVEGLAAVRVIAHLVWDLSFQPIGVTDPALSAEILHQVTAK